MPIIVLLYYYVAQDPIPNVTVSEFRMFGIWNIYTITATGTGGVGTNVQHQ
jgi:hypothetical protein